MNINHDFQEKLGRKKARGFSLVEVLVSVSIMGVIMTVVLYNYGSFNNNLALSAAGQEMAIAVRQAQTYGLTVREVSIGGGQFDAGYGIFFDPVGSPSEYYIFADIDGDKKYDAGSGCGSGSTECIEMVALRNGIRISSVCDATSCPPSGTVRAMHVSFLRPSPDAFIYFTNSSYAFVGSASATGKVTLMSPSGATLLVTMESTGQVLVE